MSLREKIGQMMMVGFEGFTPSAEIITLLREYKVGSLVYFSKNIDTPEQVFHLTKQLQQLASEATGIPLCIGVDQEGGMVVRFKEGISQLPASMAVGAARNAAKLYEAAKGTAKELSLLGINMNFAPIVDINSNPLNPIIDVRSFGDREEIVSEMGIATLAGLQDGGISAVVKHFPGHGDTEMDSHVSLPIIKHDLERIRTVELVPFQKCIAAGVDAIMTAHVVIPAIDPDKLPSTLSEKVITKWLRETFQFDGVIISDCIEMGAISEEYGAGNAAVMAVEAGVDIVMSGHTYEMQIAAVLALENAVNSGRLSEERINQSVERILRLKEARKIGLSLLSWEEIRPQLMDEQTLRAIKQLREESITVISNESSLLPLAVSQSTYILWPTIVAASHSENLFTHEASLGTYFTSHMNATITEESYETNPLTDSIARFVETAQKHEQIIVGLFDVKNNPGQVELVKALTAISDKVIVVSVRNPVDFTKMPTLSSMVVCYEHHPVTLEALADVLLGHLEAKGKLPVTISDDYAFGWSY
ncbi:beta-N-acetylhexosaminidase [Paenibacillus sp. SYP-B3998]|uniref:Beta-N-acetylhexosaminidase n=1 Tax=Paenibacillus sp. SYP-B3998 TaxID=2678564 RepID=A0A6G3ZRL7_9BACL|nr:beta-N-acetylhexosaminidase [Paenibacillus sp. SYP-B3998]NEW04853.1 beta-N-acetylhexosaminidase [Paenibacillus sp. SYP-B3998]